MAKLFRSLIASVVIVFLFLRCGAYPQAGIEDKKLRVAVVGSNVESEDPASSDEVSFPTNRAQGPTMWHGVRVAYEKSPRLRRVRGLIELKGFDDGGAISRAEKIAKNIIRDSHIIAIIGHATSPSTKIAAPIYHDAGIPLLMPIATGADVPVSHGGDRFKNCFRIVPEDDRVQAPAVGLLTEWLDAERLFLVADMTRDAAGYSEPLCEAVHQFLHHRIVNTVFEIEDDDDHYSAARRMKTERSDLVIFCGYGTTLTHLLSAMEARYQGEEVRPKVIATDGCRGEELDPKSFDVFLTFPVPPIDQCSSPEAEFVKISIGESKEEAFQVPAYDAMLMVGDAIEACRDQGRVSRACVRKHLNELSDFPGACGAYSFQNGENVISSYQVFEVIRPAGSDITRFEFSQSFSANDLLTYAAANRAGEVEQ